jgi:hypothetical protein
MEAAVFLCGAIAFAITIRVISGFLDGKRIKRHIAQQGWKLLSYGWDPLGPGWFGERDSRIYQLYYRDKIGNVHHAHVKTSMLSGIYLANDSIVQKAPGTGQEALANENKKLREYIKKLEGEKT